VGEEVEEEEREEEEEEEEEEERKGAQRGSLTYCLQNETELEVCAKLKVLLEARGFKLTKGEMNLPFMYWAAKMHKNPVSERYITTSIDTITKKLSQLVCKCLKLVQQQVKRHCNYKGNLDGLNRFWIASSSEPVLQGVRKLNLLRLAKNLATYDFSTLYTNIPHQRLKDQMRWVINLAFKNNKGYPFMNVWGRGASWRKKQNKEKTMVDKKKLIELVEFLLDNLYVKCGDMVFRQMIGIPMGSDCAPFLANLYLFACEYQWLDKQLKRGSSGLALARKFKWTYRYIDDLLTFNNDGILGIRYKEVYGLDLVLKKETKRDSKGSFLDLDLTLNNGCCQLSTYDKRDAFPFDVRSFPDLTGNLPFKESHGVLIGQLVRFGKSCDFANHFFSRVKSLTKRLLRQSFNEKLLFACCRKFYVNYPHLVRRYKVDELTLARNCFGRFSFARQRVRQSERRKRKRERKRERKSQKKS